MEFPKQEANSTKKLFCGNMSFIKWANAAYWNIFTPPKTNIGHQKSHTVVERNFLFQSIIFEVYIVVGFQECNMDSPVEHAGQTIRSVFQPF